MKRSDLLTRKSFLILLLAVVLILLPSFVSNYYVGLVIQIFIMAIFAMSLDLLVGHTGLPSLGHAAYFGIAAYGAGFLYMAGMTNFWMALLLGMGLGALMAALFGLLALRALGAYFMLITLALSQVLWGIAFKWRSLTGGDDGLPGIGRPTIGMGIDLTSDPHFYYLTFAIFVAAFMALFILIQSPLGCALRGIRESESRMKALGYNVWLYKYLGFVFAGIFAGISGVLWVYYGGFVGPTYLAMDNSAKPLLMLILGGSGSLFGPSIGAGIIVLLENMISGLTQRWSFFIGIVYVLVVLLFSEGIVTVIKRRGR